MFESPIVAIGDYRCCARTLEAGPEEVAQGHEIALVRTGVFALESRGRRTICDSTNIVFFTAGESYRVSHPAGCGDSCTVFQVAPETLHEIASRHDPAAEDRPHAPFRVSHWPSASRMLLAHRQLLVRVRARGADRLGVEEAAISLVGEAMSATSPDAARPSSRARSGTLRAHRELADGARPALARKLREAVSLDAVAREVHSSPYHLCRVFRRHVGLSMHRYLTRLRVAAGLERLTDGREDLSSLARDLGFADQSHFTNAFSREFGIPPGVWRSLASGRIAKTMSKKLQDSRPGSL